MTESNFAGNIIVNLSNLPDFLRKPILKKRMTEFFSMSTPEKEEIINNALKAGPEIPFLNFSKLFKTWLEILVILSDEQRKELFLSYIEEITKNPQKLINFNLDGILEIFLSLNDKQKSTIAKTMREVITNLENEKRRRLTIIIPDNAKKHLNL